MKIYTIGFTKKSAQKFFDLVRGSAADRLVDVRLHKSSQLAGFAKQGDLAYFLKELCDVAYVAEQDLAPEPEMLAAYRARRMGWAQYEQRFVDLMGDRRIELSIKPELIDNSVLLCSEDDPARCHRRLVADYLSKAWGGAEIVHLR